MFELIEKIRNKPEKTQKKIAFLFSFFFVGIIFVVWITVLFPEFLWQKEKEDKVASLEPSAFSAFFSTMSQGISDMGKNISQIKDVSANIIENFAPESHYVSTSTTNTTSDILNATTSSQNIEYIPDTATSTATSSEELKS